MPMESPHKDSETSMCVCVCLCVCVSVCMLFLYTGGDLNLNTQTHGDLSRWGPKLRSPWVNKLINHTE